jgi:hypothetical protein
MKDKQIQGLMAVGLTPKLISLIMERRGMDYRAAFSVFLNSNLYAALDDIETGVWHLSYETLYSLLDEELRAGAISWPEEQSG